MFLILMIKIHHTQTLSAHSLNCQEKPELLSSVGWLKVSLQYMTRVLGVTLMPPSASRWGSCRVDPLAPSWMRRCSERKRQYWG